MDSFHTKDSAVSEAIRLEVSGLYSGIKIFNEYYDSDSAQDIKKLVYTWFEGDKDQDKRAELDENLARQKTIRRSIRRKKELERKTRNKQLMGYLSMAAGVFVAITGLVLLSAIN